jgi:hypothetical protein
MKRPATSGCPMALRANQINDRETNITIGTAYLKRALDDFGGSMAAGRCRVQRRTRSAARLAQRPGDRRRGIWAENVPFDETRDYVKKVLPMPPTVCRPAQRAAAVAARAPGHRWPARCRRTASRQQDALTAGLAAQV